MHFYVGISNKTGRLVAGEMLIEVQISGKKKKETLTILDFEDLRFHPVEACIKFPLPENF